MKRDIKWMLLGIFLGVAAVWCMAVAIADNSTLHAVLGYYILPVVAVIVFATGFTGVDNSPSSKNTDVPQDTENKE